MTPDTLAVMAAQLAPASAGAVERVQELTAQQLGAALVDVGILQADRAEAVAAWDAARRDERVVTVLAQVVAAVEAARGLPTAPLHIWPDLDDAGDVGRLFYLDVIALCAPGMRRYLEALGVPGDVIASTSASFVHHAVIHREKYGTAGVDAGWWQLLALRGELLEIGRLQYHLVVLGASTLSPFTWYDEAEARRRGPGFRHGDAHLGLHIPAGPGFDGASLDASLARARDVLGSVWPATQRRLASCGSWLLDEALRDYLAPSSHILDFQRRFTMVPGGYDDDADTLEFVFRRPNATLDDLPQDTTLQRAIVARLRAGEHWRARTGWFDFDGS